MSDQGQQPAPQQQQPEPQRQPEPQQQPEPRQQAEPQPSESQGGGKPSHIAYHVRDTEEGGSYFNRVGAAFAHKDGEGYSVILDSMPVDGRVTLRTLQDRLNTAKTGNGQARGGQEEPER